VKRARFNVVRPSSVGDATPLLNLKGNARLIAVAQSLGPMLNLRLAQPHILIDLTGIPEILGESHALTIGACVTTANIEDGRLPGSALEHLSAFAAHCLSCGANRGTIGGSLCHADPSADWVIVLSRAIWRHKFEMRQATRPAAIRLRSRRGHCYCGSSPQG
jgi:aerobic carbon-monoxide dehydrogenase medium subunit